MKYPAFKISDEPLELIERDECDQPDRDMTARRFRRLFNEIERMRATLSETERFMAYFSDETDGHFVGPGTPTTCLAEIRGTLAAVGGSR